MSYLVDTSVWSLALRRDEVSPTPEVVALRQALAGTEIIFTTGIILQELLQGFSGPRAQGLILSHFEALPVLQPDQADHVAAAGLRNLCRRNGVQLGTIDALIAQIAIRYQLTLLTTDRDFIHASRHIPLRLWEPDG